MKPILLVEDDVDDVELTRMAFKRSRILNPLVVATDGVEALDYLGLSTGRAIVDDPVVVLLDLNLPRLGGLDVLARIRANERTRHVPVVILTSSKGDEERITASALQVNAYLQKPVDFDGFVCAAREVGLFWTVLNPPSDTTEPTVGAA